MSIQGVVRSLSELEDLLRGTPWVVFDFETTGLSPQTDEVVGLGLGVPKGIFYVPLAPYRRADTYERHEPLPPHEVGARLRPYVSSVPFLAWNLKFDQHFLYKLVGQDLALPVDVMVAYWLLNEEAEHGLKDVVKTLTGVEQEEWNTLKAKTNALLRGEITQMRKAWQREQKALFGRLIKDSQEEAKSLFPDREASNYDIPLDWVAPYCRRDVAFTTAFWFGFIAPSLREEELAPLFFNIEMPFAQVLSAMERRGVRADLDLLAQEERRFQAETERAQRAVWQAIGEELNLNGGDDLREFLFARQGYEPSGRLTKTGKDSLDERALKLLHAKYVDQTDLFGHLLAYRRAAKYEGEVKHLRDHVHDGRMYTKLNQVGTVTGRLSSSKPNLQNIPKEGTFRRIFKASEGMLFVKVDYSQAELRILAERTRDPLLLRAFTQGLDIHEETMKHLGLKDRRLAKVINFLMVYGGGAKTYRENLLFDHNINRSLEDCRRDIAKFYRTYEAIEPWKERVLREAREMGYVQTRLGRRRHVNLKNALDERERAYAERQAVNVLIQGDVADLMRLAMIRLEKDLGAFGARLLLQVHDELLIECDEEKVEACARHVKSVMENVWPHLAVPIVADVEVGPNWNETKKVETNDVVV